MAEQVGTPIVGENESGSSLNPVIQEQKQENPYKEKAKKLGWKSERKWVESGRDPADWVPAREFLGRQSLFDKIKSQNEALTRFHQAREAEMAEIRKYVAQQSDIEYKRALADLKQQKKEAVANADPQEVERIDEQIEDIQTAHRETTQKITPPTPQVPQAVVDWQQENKWYETNQEMRAEADTLAIGYAAKYPDVAKTNPKAVLDYVSQRIRQVFPDQFGQQKVGKEGKGSKVEGSGNSRSPAPNSPKGGISWSDLTKEQKAIANTVIRSGVLNDKAAKNKITPQEQYLVDVSSAMTV